MHFGRMPQPVQIAASVALPSVLTSPHSHYNPWSRTRPDWGITREIRISSPSMLPTRVITGARACSHLAQHVLLVQHDILDTLRRLHAVSSVPGTASGRLGFRG